MLKRLSIRQKQMVVIMATSSIALLLACGAFVVYELISFRETMTANLSSLASVIGNNCIEPLLFNDSKVAREILNSLNKEPHVVAACIYDKDGHIFEKYSWDGKAFQFPRRSLTDTHQFSSEYLDLFRRIDSQGERVGTIYICSTTEQLWIRLRQYVGIVSSVLGASMIVALIISLRLQRVVSEPMLHLAATAREVSIGKNYALRATKRSEDEMGQLIEGFNEMLGQIQARDAALQTAHDHLEKRVQQRTRELEHEIADRQRAEVSLTQQLTRINLLNSITRAIIDRHDLESVVLVVLRQLEDHLPINWGRVYVFDSNSGFISGVSKSGGNKRNHGQLEIFPRPIHIRDTGLEACRNGETVMLQQTATSEGAVAVKLHAAGFGSALAVPMWLEDELFGILIAARIAANAFSPEESDFLKILSAQVALAAHQARLHRQLQKAYDELRETQVAVMQQERLRALGQMASGIAHDINNALCPIVVYSDLLLQDASNLSETTARNLQNIKTAGEDIAHIVSRMREFYRRRDKTDRLHSVNLNKISVQVVDLTRPRWRDIPQAQGLMVELETNLDPRVPEIIGNESELREALTNLILNSVDAMPQGGKVVIRSRLAGWDKNNASSHVLLEVSDNGTGMDEETRRRCLEPFFSTKGKRGTGLGLAMVYGVIERHDGNIEIESTLGRGTLMRLIFPVRSTRQSGSTAPAPLPPLPAMRILCIDDEPLLREMLKQILENGGHSVELADGGQTGLQLFRAARERGEPFEIVVTDLGMPYLDGRELAKTLKRESPATPVIMLTGWGSMMKEDGDLPAEVDGVISKPPKIAELYQMLRTVTHQSGNNFPLAANS